MLASGGLSFGGPAAGAKAGVTSSPAPIGPAAPAAPAAPSSRALMLKVSAPDTPVVWDHSLRSSEASTLP